MGNTLSGQRYKSLREKTNKNFVYVITRFLISIYSPNTAVGQTELLPFVIMPLNYIFSLPDYVYTNVVIGIGATHIAFTFRTVIIISYLLYLWVDPLEYFSCSLLDNRIPVCNITRYTALI